MSEEPRKPEGEPKKEVQPCGCIILTYPNDIVQYDPCVPCALSRAGEMLSAAGNRLRRVFEGIEKPRGPRIQQASTMPCEHGNNRYICPACQEAAR